MEKGIIIYQSKYGATKKYAQWLQDLCGAWDESKMKFVDRTLCKILQRSVAKKDPETYEPWMRALMCAVGQTCDWTDKKYLAPLVDYLHSGNFSPI